MEFSSSISLLFDLFASLRVVFLAPRSNVLRVVMVINLKVTSQMGMEEEMMKGRLDSDVSEQRRADL